MKPFILSCLLMALMLVGCQKNDKEPALRLVKTLKVKPASTSTTRTFTGIARSNVAVKLSFKVQGTITAIHVHRTQHVEVGDSIADVDSSFYRLKLDEAKASLIQVKTKRKHAKAQYERVKQLYVNRSSSLTELDNAKTARDSVNAQYQAMSKRFEQANLELSYTTLRAPISGSISDVFVQKGENVNSSVVVATISNTKSIEIPIAVPSTLIDKVYVGQSAQIHFDAFKNRTFKAHVKEVSNTSKARTTTFLVVVELDDTNARVLPGMSASVSLKFMQKDAGCNCFVVPLHAVLHDDESAYVYVVDEQDDGLGIVSRLNVTTGDLNDDGIVITKGLRIYANVLIAGMSRVYEGMKVRLRP